AYQRPSSRPRHHPHVTLLASSPSPIPAPGALMVPVRSQGARSPVTGPGKRTLSRLPRALSVRRMRTTPLCLLACALLLAACDDAGEADDAMTVEFRVEAAGETVRCGQDYDGLGTT